MITPDDNGRTGPEWELAYYKGALRVAIFEDKKEAEFALEAADFAGRRSQDVNCQPETEAERWVVDHEAWVQIEAVAKAYHEKKLLSMDQIRQILKESRIGSPRWLRTDR